MKSPDWSPDNWHGFDFSDACKMPEDDKQRLIEITANFRLPDLRGAVYVISGQDLVPVGNATFSGGGDTLILRVRGRDGDWETIYDCKVRSMWHPQLGTCR